MTSLFLLGATIAIVILVLTLLGVLFIGEWLSTRKKNRPRGFEVKINTGEEPVIKKERENDHG